MSLLVFKRIGVLIDMHENKYLTAKKAVSLVYSPLQLSLVLEDGSMKPFNPANTIFWILSLPRNISTNLMSNLL